MNARATDTRGTGAHCEDLACAHLASAGLSLVERNFNCRYGEIDLVMRERDVLVFVEVRYRRGSSARGGFGSGIDSVSAAKRAKLVRAASVYLSMHPRLANQPCRFDVVAVAGDTASPTLDWCRNAFEIC